MVDVKSIHRIRVLLGPVITPVIIPIGSGYSLGDVLIELNLQVLRAVLLEQRSHILGPQLLVNLLSTPCSQDSTQSRSLVEDFSVTLSLVPLLLGPLTLPLVSGFSLPETPALLL